MKKIVILIAIILVVGLVIYFAYYGLLGKKIQNLLPGDATPRYSFNTISQALEGNNYQKYPTLPISLPKPGDYSGQYFNPKTGKALYLDVSFGGGYKCCEQSTYYIYVDTTEKLFWIENYQASIQNVKDNWFGPFTFAADSTYSIRKQYSTYEEALIKDDYRTYSTNYFSLPINSGDNKFLHPVSKQALLVTDKTTKEATSLNIFSNTVGTEFWVRYGTLNVQPEFWSWYGPFEKR